MNRQIQRGYNLVEIAIVLTIALMMSSWLVTNYYRLQQDERIRETKVAIENIKEAIADYADAHRSQSFLIANSLVPDADKIYWRVPDGRPYLPCPDITGDGLEDRQPVAAVTLSVAITYWDIQPYTAECASYKGFVPWRTLNTPPADPWGNFYTYRVDPDFAYSLLGFDEETVSSSSSYIGDWQNSISPLTVTVVSGQEYVASNLIAGAITVSISVAAWDNTSIASELAPSLICDRQPCYAAAATLSLLYGEVATTVAVLRQVGGYALSQPVYVEYKNNAIVTGLPVVVLSHGQNGYGAVPSQQPAGGALHCNNIPADNLDEIQNAMRVLFSSISNCNTVTLSTSRQNGFVSAQHRPPNTPQGEFDDIVGWMTVDELKTKLTKRGVFPVEKLPPLGLENY